MSVQSESDLVTSRIRRFGPIAGFVVIEARTSLNAVLRKVYKNPKELRAAYIGLAADVELDMCADSGDLGLAQFVVAACRMD